MATPAATIGVRLRGALPVERWEATGFPGRRGGGTAMVLGLLLMSGHPDADPFRRALRVAPVLAGAVPLLGTKGLESLGVADVRRFTTRMQSATSLRPATAKEAHRVLRAALTAAVREELITRNIASLVEPPRVKQREISSWPLDETLLEAARRTGGPALVGCGPGQPRLARTSAAAASARRAVRRRPQEPPPARGRNARVVHRAASLRSRAWPPMPGWPALLGETSGQWEEVLVR